MRGNSIKRAALLAMVVVAVAGSLSLAGSASLKILGPGPKPPPPETELATAALSPVDGSGIKGVLTFVGSTTAPKVLVKGFAAGLNPKRSYVSLLYDGLSVAEGANACKPSSPDIPPSVIGLWEIDKDGVGTLIGSVEGTLESFGTVSIRIFNEEPPLPLQACGAIQRLGSR